VSDELHALALGALDRYDIEVAGCSFAAEAFNTVFRVDAADGSSYALRVGSPVRIHRDGCEELEAAWVNELHTAGVPVAPVVPARDGAPVIDVDGRRCVLFEWVSGRRLRDDPTPVLVRATGAALAAVHEHAARHHADEPVGALVPDRALYFRVDNRLPELRPTYGTALDEACARVQDVFDALWRDPPHPPHLLHGDVQPSNVIVNDGGVTLIDFQDLVWGFEILDVVIASRDDMLHGDAFRAGYETVRPWPDAAPETATALGIARYLNVLNFGLHVRKPALDEFVARIAEPVVAWMTAG
jgi:Ser/Thr protein kinase RdoA (MazF antagonist)